MVRGVEGMTSGFRLLEAPRADQSILQLVPVSQDRKIWTYTQTFLFCFGPRVCFFFFFFKPLWIHRASLVAQMINNMPAMQLTWVPRLDLHDPLEEEITTPSFSILTWRIPWTQGPGGLESISSIQFSRSVVSDSL